MEQKIKNDAAQDAEVRQRLIERARVTGLPPHPEPMRTMAYWRERCALAEAREAALREALREIAYNTNTSVPLWEWPVHHYEHNMRRCIGIAANALHDTDGPQDGGLAEHGDV